MLTIAANFRDALRYTFILVKYSFILAKYSFLLAKYSFTTSNGRGSN